MMAGPPVKHEMSGGIKLLYNHNFFKLGWFGVEYGRFKTKCTVSAGLHAGDTLLLHMKAIENLFGALKIFFKILSLLLFNATWGNCICVKTDSG